MTSEVRHRKGEIEVALSLGATPAQATCRALRAATHSAMLPAINMMMIVGIVQIPGMMSGQIIAGTKPLDAVMYQLMVIYMIATTTTISSVLASVLTRSRLFSHRQQLLYV
jgi:putative ABC transport system permease protein